MDPTMLKPVVDQASQQSDRWLLIAAVIIGGAAFYVAAKWLAAQYQKMLEQWRTDMLGMQKRLEELHSERVKAAESYAGELRSIMREQADTAKQVSQMLSQSLVRNAEVLGGVQTTLRDLQSSCAIARTSLIGPGGGPPRRGGAADGGTPPETQTGH